MNLSRYKYDLGAMGVLASLAVIWLVVVLRHLDPLVFPDSISYLRLANDIREWNWSEFYFRTPGYPAFLVLIQVICRSENPIYPAGVQLILTSSVPILLFLIFRITSKSTTIGLVCGLVFFLDWSGQLLGVAVLTEALTQFLVLTSLVLLLLYCRRPCWWLAAILGIVLFALIMIRPAFLPLSVAFAAVILLLFWRMKWINRRSLSSIGTVGFLPIVLTALWALEVKRETGTFAISHITGIALFNQVSDEVLKLDRYEDQQLLERLQHQVRTRGTENGAWVIVEEEARRGDENAWLAAIAIKKLSVHLIKKNPNAYLKQVLDNSHEFWVDSATYVFSASKTYEWMERTSFYKPLKEWTNAQYWQRPGRILFLITVMSLATILLTLSPVLAADQRAYVAAIAVTIVICMFTHVAVNGSDLARYRMPVQTLYLSYAAFVILVSGKMLGVALGKFVASVRKRAF